MTIPAAVFARANRSKVLAALGLALLSFSLTGCSVAGKIVLPGTFDSVEQAAEELDLETAGELQIDGEYGGGWWFGGDPTYSAVIGGADASSVLDGRLSELGYSKVDSDYNATYWERGSEKESLAVTLTNVGPGDTVEVGDDPSVSVDETGAWIIIRGTRA